jgi:hypothetical protein
MFDPLFKFPKFSVGCAACALNRAAAEAFAITAEAATINAPAFKHRVGNEDVTMKSLPQQ